ncbi:hypothetical protein ACFVZA_11165 [Streptomyces bottropensis]|uniref:hypothetical protein n=1 Tax=Streptomyces bottropensis TaxID=42235 RepID=UPI0036AB3B04
MAVAQGIRQRGTDMAAIGEAAFDHRDRHHRRVLLRGEVRQYAGRDEQRAERGPAGLA